MHTIHHSDLLTVLETVLPRSVLLVDPNPHGLPGVWTKGHPECAITHLHGDGLKRLAGLPRHDLGVVANTLEHLDHAAAGQLLARLRDLATRRFVVLAPLGEDWPDQRSHWRTPDLLAYGLSRLASYRLDDKPLQLFHYAIESYKSTPDWFNGRHWAHPERWRP